MISIEIKNENYAIVTESKGFKRREFHFNSMESHPLQVEQAKQFKKKAEAEGIREAERMVLYDIDKYPGLIEYRNCRFF